MFDAPALAGPSIAVLKIAPDGSRVTFLRGKDADKDCLDLWAFDSKSGASQLLIDASILRASGSSLSDEEIARRERHRTAALTGIVEYVFSPTGDALLFPVAGDLFYCTLATATGHLNVAAIPVEGPVTDATMAPSGKSIAYIRDQDLYVYEMDSLLERRLTRDGGSVIKNGMAEFVAQEEMDRSTGYWWAPDSARLAFAHIDESPVPEILRFEVAADNVKSFAQRYPIAGAENVRVAIGVIEATGGHVTWLDLGADEDVYVARVDWLPDSQTVAIQRQSRDQKRLDLLFADAATGESRVVVTETSDSWIDLHHELTFLKSRREFIWASSRTGFTHLYLYSTDGTLIRQLTDGDWNVDNFRSRAIRGVDEAARLVYFMATAQTPIERHLYHTHLDTGGISKITQAAGVHVASMSPDFTYFVDHFSSATQPPQIGLYDQAGNLKFWLLENRLDAAHPSAPYLLSNARTELGQLTAEDGQTLIYRLFKPHDFDSESLYPAILDVYGGPGVQRVQNVWSGTSFSQILTRAGFVVLMLDNRGSAHRGTAFQAPIQGLLGKVEVSDQLDGVRWLSKQPFIDPMRIGVWGWSYGGYMALMLLFKAPGVFKAGVSGAPVTDWRLYDTHYTERFLGKPADNPRGYDASSVIPYAGQVNDQLLVIHGMADDNVLLSHSTKLLRRLQDLGRLFDVMLYPGAKHGLLRQRHGRHAFATILRFFKRHV